MKIRLSQTNLEMVLQNISRIISSKPQLPILSCFLLKAKDGQITLSATDLNIGLKTKVGGEIVEEGEVAIPARIFVETVKSLGKGDLELNLSELALTIKSSKSKSVVQCQLSDDFPDFPQMPLLSGEFLTSQLKVIEKYVSFSTSLDQSRLVLTTLLFRKNESGLKVVGTDGFRLSILNFQDVELGEANEFLLSNRAFSEITKIADSQQVEKVSFEASDELKQVFFSIGEVDFFVRLIEGSYPPFEKIVPADFLVTGNFDGGEFDEALKQATVFAKELSNVVTLEFSQDKMKIIANAADKGSYEGEIDVVLTNGESGRVSFNAKYLQDFIKNVRPERIWFGMNDELKPVMFKEDGNEFYEYVAMPFRLNS